MDDNGLGNLTVTFSNCRDGDGTTTINGATRLTIRSRLGIAGSSVGDATTNFDDVTLAQGTGTFRLQGRIDVRRTTAAETTTINLTTRDNGNNRAIDLRNYVVTRAILAGEPGEEERYAGRVYLSDLGFVEVTTPTAFVYSNAVTVVPDRRGMLALGGAGASRVEFGIVSNDATRLRLDANGDGTFETSVALAFESLVDTTADDLADSDGDGMHNSWERRFGLNPNDAGDAERDADGDGASNREEHAGLGRPDRADSLPRGPADIAVTLERLSPATADTGAFIRYRLTIANLGPRTAEQPSARLVVTNGGQPSQTDNNTVPLQCGSNDACTIPELPSGQSTSATIVVAAGSVGADTVLTATANARSIDPVPGNDRATVSTPVRELSLSGTSVENPGNGVTLYLPPRGEFVSARNEPGAGVRITFTSPITSAMRTLDVAVSLLGPSLLAVTSDASTLYLANTSENSIERIDLATGSLGQFTRASGAPLQIVTVPGRNGDVIALSRTHLEYFRDGVTLYSEPGAYFGMGVSDDGQQLFVLAFDAGRSALRRYPIVEGGLGAPVTFATDNNVGQSAPGVGGGVVVLDNGAVYDQVTGARRGTLSPVGNSLLLADGSSGRVFVVPQFAPGVERGRRMRVFDIATLALVHDIDLPYACLELHRWGDDGLACRTPSTLEFSRSVPLVRQ